jgi:hypothetical protein
MWLSSVLPGRCPFNSSRLPLFPSISIQFIICQWSGLRRHVVWDVPCPTVSGELWRSQQWPVLLLEWLRSIIKTVEKTAGFQEGIPSHHLLNTNLYVEKLRLLCCSVYILSLTDWLTNHPTN